MKYMLIINLKSYNPQGGTHPATAAPEVTAFYQECDGRKSRRALPAAVECLDASRVGVRRVGVRFLEHRGVVAVVVISMRSIGFYGI